MHQISALHREAYSNLEPATFMCAEQSDSLFNDLRKELEAHLVKEETLVFPALRDSSTRTDEGREKIRKLIEELETEHDAAGDIIKELRSVTRNFVPPEDGCGTYEIAFHKLSELEENTFNHIHLENNILFNRL